LTGHRWLDFHAYRRCSKTYQTFRRRYAEAEQLVETRWVKFSLLLPLVLDLLPNAFTPCQTACRNAKQSLSTLQLGAVVHFINKREALAHVEKEYRSGEEKNMTRTRRRAGKATASLCHTPALRGIPDFHMSRRVRRESANRMLRWDHHTKGGRTVKEISHVHFHKRLTK
jgi:hypothetical protein